MTITIIGAGAIGGICGAYLTRAGRDVVLVEPFKEHRDRIRREVFIDGVRGEIKQPLDAIAPEDLAGPLGLVLLAVKSPKTVEAVESIMPHAGPDTLVVSMQNGINEDTIARMLGADRVIGCVIGWGATFTGPGHLTQTSEGKFTIGELDGRISDRLDDVKGVLDDIAETLFTPNIYGHLWAKLCINCLILSCSILGQTVGEALAPERNKRVFKQLVAEVVRTAEACGVTIEKFEGVVDPSIFTSADKEGVELCYRIFDMMAALHGRIYPGPLQDIAKGWKTEVDYVTGYCVDRAAECGVPVPINTAVRQHIHALEAGALKPSPENIKLLEAATC
jgi:2-dehydropantoate 2-reductase